MKTLFSKILSRIVVVSSGARLNEIAWVAASLYMAANSLWSGEDDPGKGSEESLVFDDFVLYSILFIQRYNVD